MPDMYVCNLPEFRVEVNCVCANVKKTPGGARLLGVVAWNASLVETKLVGANFQAADLYGVNMRAADLASANLSYTRLSGVNFSEAAVEGVNWLEAILPAGFEPK